VTITVKLTVPVEEEYIEIYRCHADGTHRTSDVGDPVWNMKLQPQINPDWCFYAYELNDDDKVTQFTFKDTFSEGLLKDELPQCNSIHYIIYDTHENVTHDIMIRISNILYYDVITGIEDVAVDFKSEYYDINGRVSDVPFKGINIVKTGDEVKKVIY
jgi:hypothetical protein